MPPITTISAHAIRATGDNAAGLKGQLFAHTLSGVDIFCGPNGAGKTTRLMSIVYAVLGIASTPADELLPYLETVPENTGATIATDADSFTRELDQGTRTKHHKTANEDARRVIGQLPVAWDLSDWARATRGGRNKILDTIARAGGAIESWDVPRAQQEAHVLEGGRWPALCVQALPTADDGSEWLRAAIEWAEGQQLAAGRTAKSAIGAATAAKHDTVRPGGEKEDKASRTALIEERAGLNRSGAERVRAQQALEQHDSRGIGLRSDMQRLTDEGKRLGMAEPEPEATTNPALKQAVKDAEARLAECPPVPADEATRLTQEHLLARNDLDMARRNVSSAEGQVKAMEGLQEDAICVHCSESDPLGIGPRLEESRRTMEECQQRYTDAHAADQAAEEALKAAEAKHADHKQAARDLEQAKRAAAAEGPAAADRVQAWRNRELIRQTALEQARGRYAAMRAALAAWESSPPPVVPEDTDHSVRISAIGLVLDGIQDREKDRADWDAAQRISIESAQQAERAQLAHEQCRAFVQHLKVARDTMAAKAYGPIEEAARRLVYGQDTLPRPYFRGPDSYGADCGYGEVPYHDLSESEQVITAAALVYALAVVSAQPCRLVLLDGLEVVQASRRPALLRALAAAEARGDVDTIVGTLACDMDEALPDVDGVVYHMLDPKDRRQRQQADPEPTPVQQATAPMPDEPTPIVSAPVLTDDCPF